MEGQKITKSAFAVEMHKRLDKGLVTTEEIKKLGRIEGERRIKSFSKPTAEEQLAQEMELANNLRKMNIAVEAEQLDSQMYEVPIPFLQLMLGGFMKQSSCYFKDESTTIDEAELAMEKLHCERAQIKDGQRVIDVGCGQGSFILYVAQNYKKCDVFGLTNSVHQKDFIEAKSKELRLSNVKVILADAATYETEETFDRIVVVGLMEHLKNYELFLRKLSKWLTKDGLLFVDLTCHKAHTVSLERVHEDDWAADYAIPAGSSILPSVNFILYFQEDLTVVNHWILSGMHYSRTFEEWSKRLNAKAEKAKAILEKFSGDKEAATKMLSYWKLVTAYGSQFFGINNGQELLICHFLLKKK